MLHRTRTIRLAFTTITAALGAGCQTVHSADEASRLTDAEVCAEYGYDVEDFRELGFEPARRGFAKGRAFDPLVREIQARELIRPAQLHLVLRGEAAVGMTEVEVLCAWGKPARRDPLPSGETLVFIPRYLAKNERYVDIVDDRVTEVRY